MRGIIPARMISHLEKKIRQYTGIDDAKIIDYFDFFAGTSTGALLMSMMLAPEAKMTRQLNIPIDGDHLAQLYYRYGEQIFHKTFRHQLQSLRGWAGPLYPVEPFESLLIDRIGKINLSDLTRPCLLPTYDMTTREAVFFTQHTAGRTDKDYPLWQVVRAATAAPTYFRPMPLQRESGLSAMIDGGVVANDPAMFAYVEARKLFRPSPTAAGMLLVSLGTGRVRTSYTYPQSRRWGAVQWIDPILDVLTSASSETVSYEVQKLFDAEAASDQYFRFQVDLPQDQSDMDDARPEMLAFWDSTAQNMMTRYQEAIDYLVPLLVNQGG